MATNVTADSLLDRVKDIAPIIREHAAEAEEKRRLSRPVVDAMLQAGLYSMSSPKAFGGLELDPLTLHYSNISQSPLLAQDAQYLQCTHTCNASDSEDACSPQEFYRNIAGSTTTSIR